LRPAVLLAVIPAVPLLALGISGEYWGRIHLLWGVTFAAVNCVSLVLMLKRGGSEREQVPSTGRFFSRQVIAWCLSFLALGVINLTPLCLGQNNGDGRNGLVLCLMLTVIWPVFMSVFVVPLAYVASVGMRRVALGGVQQDGGLYRPKR
jgi:hypothetical protein